VVWLILESLAIFVLIIKVGAINPLRILALTVGGHAKKNKATR